MSDISQAASRRFTSFVMLAEMRTGSNFLEANLNALDGVTCHGEMFNPHFIGGAKKHEMFGFDLEAREKDPLGLLAAMRAGTEGLTGFRYFHDHDRRILPAVMEDASCAKIILTRNPLESFVSWQIARATDQWRLTNVKNLRTAKAEFNAAAFESHLEKTQSFQMHLLHQLQCSGQTAFYLDYEDIQDLGVLNGLAAWLGVEARLEAVDQTLKKQNPGPITDKVVNPEEMADALRRIDRFNLARTPNFEPRRLAGVPGFRAARDVPLLYLPIKGGPVAGVTAWLEKLGGGLIADFDRKSLREWERRNPGHLSFTVLRHPLLRAHVAFTDQIVSGRQSEHRHALIRSQGAELPGKGKDFADDASHHAAFLAFLRYAKLSLSGQTSQKPAPHWASQSATLQGFSNQRAADIVLREDRLATGLTFLAAEFSLPSPEMTSDPRPAHALDRIWAEDLEEAAREAWPKDYSGFGFRSWKE